jgi:hypothetical protein
VSSDAHVLAELGQIKDIVLQLAAKAGIEPKPRGEYSDIIPSRLYTVRELVALRGGNPQNLYRAMKAGDLKETPTNGEKRVRGEDYVAYLEKRKAKAG